MADGGVFLDRLLRLSVSVNGRPVGTSTSALDLSSAFTAAYNPVTNTIDVDLTGLLPPGSFSGGITVDGTVTAQSLALGAAYVESQSASGGTPITTTGSATQVLVNVAPAAGKTTVYTTRVVATISTADGAVLTAARFVREDIVTAPTGGAVLVSTNVADTRTPIPFQSSNSSGTTGTVFSAIVGGRFLVQAHGVGTPQLFASGGVYAVRALVYNTDSPVHLYVVSVGGVDSSSGGPTGTTSPQSVGGLTYLYLGQLAGLVTSWNVTVTATETC